MLVAGTVPLELDTVKSLFHTLHLLWVDFLSWLESVTFTLTVMPDLSDCINNRIWQKAKKWLVALTLISVLSFKALKVMHKRILHQLSMTIQWVNVGIYTKAELRTIECHWLSSALLVLHNVLLYCVLQSSAALHVHCNSTLQRKVPNSLFSSVVKCNKFWRMSHMLWGCASNFRCNLHSCTSGSSWPCVWWMWNGEVCSDYSWWGLLELWRVVYWAAYNVCVCVCARGCLWLC